MRFLFVLGHPKITTEIDGIEKNNGKVEIAVKDDAPAVEKQQIFSEYRIIDERTFE